MILQCSNCGGSVTANGEHIRRGVVVCDYCHTALRINKTGIEAYKKRYLNRKPPKGIEIKRNKKEIKIIIPIGYRVLFGKRALFVLIGTLVIGLISWAIGVRGQLLFAPSALFLLISGLMLSTTPYMLLQDRILQIPIPYSPQNHRTAVAEIKQLYVTVNRLVQGETSRTQYNLFALKKDGARVRLYGDFTSLEAALYVEEWLEIELDIFDLPVFGDLQTRAADVVAFPTQPDEQMICYACAALLPITAAVRHQGYLTCAYCHTITLLYTQDSHKLILGQPNPEKMIYRIRTQKQFAGVLQKENRQAILLLSENKIRESRFNMTLSGKAVKSFGIRKIFVPRNLTVKDLFSGKIMSQYEQALAYSQDASLSNKPLDITDFVDKTVQYMIMGQIGTNLYPLIPMVEDLHEAAYIVVTLNNFLESLQDS